MATALIYIIRCMGYLRHTPYIKEVRGFAPYDRCRSIKIMDGFLVV